CVQQGHDPASFASDLELRARELLVVTTLEQVPAELSLTAEADDALRAQAERVDRATLVRLLELLGEAMEAVRAGADARTRLELALVKAARPALDGSTPALLARIERLERGRGAAGDGSADDPPSARDAALRSPHAAAPAAPRADSPPEPPDGDSSSAAGVAGTEVAEGPAVADLESLRSLWPAVVDLVRA